ncbi:MAG TPA: hypothetical protein DCK76_08200 [Desulfotomaculum sp.]|nr:hypothetical protein [Desulfotomaculum sp.]HBY03106.1 hypothetical protein [Desulfotomaculum sp.]
MSKSRLSRSVVAVCLLISGFLLTLTGLTMLFTHADPGHGRQLMLIGMTRHQFYDIHILFALITLLFGIIHIIINWKAFISSFRYLFKD